MSCASSLFVPHIGRHVKCRQKALEVVDRAYRFILQGSKSLYIQADQVSKSSDISKQSKRVTKYKHDMFIYIYCCTIRVMVCDNESKSWLIVKSGILADEAKREINVSTEVQRHLGAVIGSQEFKDQYCREKVLGWKGELEVLSDIARSQPHAAFTVFTKGYKSKFTYFMCTIGSFEDYVDPIQEVIDDLFLPTLFGQTEPLPSDLRQLFTLTPAQGGLGMPDLRFEAPQQFAASTLITAAHEDSIATQGMFMVEGDNSTKELKRQHKALKIASVKSRMQSIDSTLPMDLLQSVNQLRHKGASSWLIAVPLIDHGLVLNKQEFRDSLRLRYNMPLSDLPSKCVCGEKYTVCHALSCKKGGFVAQRHYGVYNLLTSLIDKVCTNVQVEPQLQPLDNEQFNLRSAVTSPEARLDITFQGAFGLEELQHCLMSE